MSKNPGETNLDISVRKLLEDSRRAEQQAINAVPFLVRSRACTAQEGDEIVELCLAAIAEIDEELSKLP